MSDSTALESDRRAPPLQQSRARRAFVKSFGCQMNVYDSQRMADLVALDGYAEAAGVEDADLIVLNTCHIRQKASEKIYSELGKLRDLKEGRQFTLVVAGCLAQAEAGEILRRQPAVDVVVGPQSYHRLPELLRKAAIRSGVIDTDFPVEEKFSHLPAMRAETFAKRGVAAFVTVQEGCDKFCSFCVVPYTRGAEFSRPASAVFGEIVGLARAGVREVTLIGQNVNAYHGVDHVGRTTSLAGLIAAAAGIPEIRRLRYTTSHPKDMGNDLIAAHRDVEILAPYLHLPLQSGSDRILTSMNRRHRVSDYLDIVAQARAARPDIALSSDFIVGYPGETEADFEQTLELVRRVGYASSFAFKFSTRPGTPAADMDGQVDEDVKIARLAALQAVLEEQRQSFNAACLGRRFEVLFEKPARHEGQVVGRSPYMQTVYAPGPLSLIGTMAEVEVIATGSNSLRARIVSSAS